MEELASVCGEGARATQAGAPTTQRAQYLRTSGLPAKLYPATLTEHPIIRTSDKWLQHPRRLGANSGFEQLKNDDAQ